ncbi:MAG: autoinducer synthase [Sphingomonas sp.]|uniref:acyl-homoserine-lactone synthase n=1 Tax=Sphingomonas sp. TaxID=28214 RepID=UPI0025F39EE9|nr:acyl-homoserine-lactone synthase [Sphingomonas sp.]MBX3563600.1 autoinducer synthase [Sphingomonas sp.]
MIHIVQGMQDAAHAQALESMFIDRKRLFVDLLGWDVPIVDGRFEMDRFDGPDACYLIACDGAGDHIGSMRLLPTSQPHLLDTLFADLCNGEVPAGSDTYEITRLCMPSRLGAVERLRIRNLLISAMVDHALEQGIVVMTGVVQADFRHAVLAMGWRCAPLGPERTIGQRPLGAFRLEIDADTPSLLALNGIYTAGARARSGVSVGAAVAAA